MSKDNSTVIAVGVGAVAVVGIGLAVAFSPQNRRVPNVGAQPVPNPNQQPYNPGATTGSPNPVVSPAPATGGTQTLGQRCADLQVAIRQSETNLSSARQRLGAIQSEAEGKIGPMADKLACTGYLFGMCNGCGQWWRIQMRDFINGKINAVAPLGGDCPDIGGNLPGFLTTLNDLRSRIAVENATIQSEQAARDGYATEVQKLRSQGVIC